MGILGIIPARGGSKRIPRKNVVDLGGRPLIAWTIEAALASGVLDRVVVSTENADIARAAIEAGAEVPFLRPDDLSDDRAPTRAGVVHALDALAEAGWTADIVVLLQPTSPFRDGSDIEGALAMHRSVGGHSVVSVVEAEMHPFWSFRLDADAVMTRLFDIEVEARRQNLPAAVRPNGAVYIVRADVLIGGGDWYSGPIYGYRMPPERSLDIDTPWDLELARLIAGARADAGTAPAFSSRGRMK